MDTNKTIIIGLIAALIIGGIVTYFAYTDVARENAPGAYDELAQCLTDKGVKFYGAFWCPHCQNNKKAFGNSAKLLPYIECSTANGQNQLQICKDAGISGYPTWELPDGTRLNGEQSPEALAQATGCPLPQGSTDVAPVETGGASTAE